MSAAPHEGDWAQPLYVISVAAELTGMHPQTLRQYDRLGLVVPRRQGGRQRRYSRQDVEQLRTIQQLSREGVSLEGIRRIVRLQRQVEQLQGTVQELVGQIHSFQRFTRHDRVFTAGAEGDVTATFGGFGQGSVPDDVSTARRRPRPRSWPLSALAAGPRPLRAVAALQGRSSGRDS